jgi:hypothetical protein
VRAHRRHALVATGAGRAIPRVCMQTPCRRHADAMGVPCGHVSPAARPLAQPVTPSLCAPMTGAATRPASPPASPFPHDLRPDEKPALASFGLRREKISLKSAIGCRVLHGAHGACCMVLAWCSWCMLVLMVHGAWRMVLMVHGAWCSWCMVHDAWRMVHGAWCMVHGAWCSWCFGGGLPGACANCLE